MDVGYGEKKTAPRNRPIFYEKFLTLHQKFGA